MDVRVKVVARKSRNCRVLRFAHAKEHTSIFSRKTLLASSNAQNFLAARPPSGARGASGPRSQKGSLQFTNPPRP